VSRVSTLSMSDAPPYFMDSAEAFVCTSRNARRVVRGCRSGSNSQNLNLVRSLRQCITSIHRCISTYRTIQGSAFSAGRVERY
jgi:hypothetical protein